MVLLWRLLNWGERGLKPTLHVPVVSGLVGAGVGALRAAIFLRQRSQISCSALGVFPTVVDPEPLFWSGCDLQL